MAFYAFTSSDSGAPTLNGVNGAWINVLDWVIVTKGGGTKVFSGTNKAIYQLAGGGMYLRVVHDSTITGEARKAEIRGCETCTGIDAYTDPFPLVAQASASQSAAYASISSDSTARPYFGVVTDTFVAVIVKTSSNNQTINWCFGLCPPMLSSDVWSTVICIEHVGYSSYGITGGTSAYSQPSYFFARNVDGSVKSSAATPRLLGGGALGSSANGPAYPHPYDAKLHHAPVALTCQSTASPGSFGAKSMPVRAWLPHIREPLHAASLISSGDTFTDTSYNPSFVGKLFQNETYATPWGILEFSNTWSPP